MRIGIDCRSLQEPHPSGVSLYTASVAQQLIAEGQDEYVLFGNASGLGAHVPPMMQQLQALSSDNPSVEWRLREMPNKLFTALAVATGHTPSTHWMFGDVDVVLVPNMQFFPIADSGTPYVLVMHDLSFERYPECLDAKGRWRHRLLFPRRFARNAAHIVTVSEHTALDVHELYGVPQERITAVHSAVPSFGSQSAQQMVVDDGAVTAPQRDAATFVCISTVEPRKNIDTLLQAFEQVRAQLPEARLLVAGGPGWKSADVINRMQQQLGVEYRGYISETEKRQLLQQATAFVYPTLYEGFGLPPLEAQQLGAPVITGYHSSLPEVLHDSALYADVLDSNSLARAMVSIAGDHALQEHYHQRGTENVERFTWKQTADQIRQVLHAVAQR